jgi:hypothetical protein
VLALYVPLNIKLSIINDNLKASHVQKCNSHTAEFKKMVINYRETWEIQIFTQTDHFPIYAAVISPPTIQCGTLYSEK